MSDDPDLKRLKAALDAAAPQPDPARRAEALARAMAEFERAQGSAGQGSARQARPTSGRPSTGAALTRGVRAMLSALTTRAGLAGTASLAVLAIGLAVVVPEGGFAPPGKVPAVAPPPAPTGATISVAAPPAETEPAAKLADAASRLRAETSAPAPASEPLADASSLAESAVGIDADQVARAPRPEAGFATQGEAALQAINGNLPALAVAPDRQAVVQPDTEAYPEAAPNPLRVTAEDPVSTFSIDVDTASYAVVRSSLMLGQLPPEGAVRIEEMVNYFPYDWPAPGAGEAPFRTTVGVMATPWNPGTRLVSIALKGRMPALEDRPPLNLVFLVDTSGSMQDANKLPLLKQSLRLMLPELRPTDEVAIVAYAGSAGEVLPPTPASDRAAILGALDRLSAGGSTAGGEGLRLAYDVAGRMAAEGEVSRVLLLTDGDFNVGISDPAELEEFIAAQREDGTYLSVLGFGRGNLDDAVMQALAQNGNGTAAYIDTLSEARKVLVDELSGALFPIADDVKVQIEWNPATVAEYRLIGYETRALAREDFANDRVDAGEIGAGHTVAALYEVTPVGSPARLTDDLRYQAQSARGTENELGFLRLRYKLPGEDASRLIETPIAADVAEAGPDARFAAAIAGFGQLLTDGAFLGDWGWDEAIALALSARGEDPYGYRAEAVELMRLAQSISR